MWLTDPEAVTVLSSPQSTVMSDPDIGRVIDSSAVVVLQVVTNASAGSVVSVVISILMIWTPSSSYAVTAAYVLPPDSNVVMLIAP